MSLPELEDPQTLIENSLNTLGIIREHSEACLQEASDWLHNDGLDDPALVDLTGRPFVTIDNEDSRDLDQALLIESQPQGGYRVLYALADAAYYIRPGSALFEAAVERGTTYYTPLFAAPMLPSDLSEGLISLNPNVKRRALVFDIRLDSHAEVERCDILRARICSQAKLSYAGVQQWLDTSPPHTARPFDHSLLLLKELGEKLIRAGEQRGVVPFNRSESSIRVSGNPPQLQIRTRQRYATERYNEQISLLCNMQGARLLLALSGVTDVVQAIFRIHEAPLRKKLSELRDTLDALALRTSDPDRWRWYKQQTLADYIASLPQDAQHKHRVRAIERQVMLSQRGSRFTPEAGEHHALKAASYARFSSPMREVVGIYTHKELIEALGGHNNSNTQDEMLRERIIESANAARSRQRQLDKHIEFGVLSHLLSQELRTGQLKQHAGTLVGMRSDKLYVSLDEMALDIKIYKNDLEAINNSAYQFDAVSATADHPPAPSYELGQAVQLQLKSYDAERKRFIFSMA